MDHRPLLGLMVRPMRVDRLVRRIIVAIPLALMHPSLAPAQTYPVDVDSMIATLDSTRWDTVEMARLVNVLTWIPLRKDGVGYNDRLGALSDTLLKSDNERVRVLGLTARMHYLTVVGMIARDRQDGTEAVRAYRGALIIAMAHGDSMFTAYLHEMIALTYGDVDDPRRAISEYRTALEWVPSTTEDRAFRPSILLLLAESEGEVKELDLAKAHIEEARRATGDVNIRVSCMLQTFYVLDAEGRSTEARQTLLATLDSAYLLNSWHGALVNSIAATWLFEKGDLEGALAAAEHCITAARSWGFATDECLCRWRAGDLHRLLGHREQAHHYLNSAVEQARTLAYHKTQLRALRSLKDLYRAEGRYTEALRAMDSLAAYSDTMRLTDGRFALRNMEFKEQMLKDSLEEVTRINLAGQLHDRELSNERERKRMFGFFGGCAFLLAGGVFLRLRTVRRSRKALKKEKEISEALLLNILPEEVAVELKSKGYADAKHFAQATVLFTDFKGFTRISEKLSPAELVDELNICFKAFDHIITARGIEKIKTIGDAYMCVGGLPDPLSSSPADVVHAAMEMQAFTKRRKAERDAQHLPTFEMRVGIHSGPVVADIVGVKKFQYDIWGDTVNTASRMESSGEVGQVNISEATYDLVKDTVVSSGLPGHSPTTDNQQPTTRRAFTFTPRGRVQAKGKGELEMYFVEMKDRS